MVYKVQLIIRRTKVTKVKEGSFTNQNSPKAFPIILQISELGHLHGKYEETLVAVHCKCQQLIFTTHTVSSLYTHLVHTLIQQERSIDLSMKCLVDNTPQPKAAVSCTPCKISRAKRTFGGSFLVTNGDSVMDSVTQRVRTFVLSSH